MTELEIIEYLKQNKEKGIAFGFMPQEAKHWCEEHKNDTIFCVYLKNGWYEGINIDHNDNIVYALPEDYESKPQFKPHWEEFEVNEDGRFFSDGDMSYPWYRWFDFITTILADTTILVVGFMLALMKNQAGIWLLVLI